MSILLLPFTAYLVTLNADLWPLKTISEKVMQGKVPLFFIGQAMFKMSDTPFPGTTWFWSPIDKLVLTHLERVIGANKEVLRRFLNP